MSWLYRGDPTVPFFLYLSFHRPHPPYDPPAWAFEQYLAAPPTPVAQGLPVRGLDAGAVRADRPRRPGLRQFEGLVELRDVMPTQLDCAGLDVPDGLDGESVLPLLRDPDAAWRDHPHGEHVMWGQSLQWIRAGDLKYVWWSGDGREQMFDLAADPDECHDLAAADSRHDDLARCRRLLVEHLRGREEGLVAGDDLEPGRAVREVLAGAGQRRR